MKKCIKCLEEKPENEFIFRKDSNSYRNECRACSNKRIRNWIKKNPENRQKTVDKFYQEHKQQYCLICRNAFKPVGKEKTCSMKCKLLSFVQKETNGCWIWKGCKAGNYGKITWRQKTISAHRACYLVFKGEVEEGKLICHTCDNPLCINPDHLWTGSHKENAIDALKKGRLEESRLKSLGRKLTEEQYKRLITNRRLNPPNKKGEKHHLHKLTENDIKEIREMYRNGFSQHKIALKYEVTQATIWAIIHRKTWSHISE